MKHFSPTFMPKTDLASEIHEYLNRKSAPDLDGIEAKNGKSDLLDFSEILVTNENGAKKVGKPIGKYTTVFIGNVTRDTKEDFKKKCLSVSGILRDFIPQKGSCLFAGLGNRRITADATGPEASDSFLVTRHIKSSGTFFESMGLRETMCISPDVMGNTGLEAAEILAGLVGKTKPDFLVVADSLATSRLDRLATTFQICNTGISPGSGVNNRRCAIDSSSVGVPVIAIGIPTVADIRAVTAELISGDDRSEYDRIAEELSDIPATFRFVTPKDADAIIRSTSKLIAYALNLALQTELDYEDMCELVRRN